MTRNIASLLAALVLGVVLSPAAFADPPADKGKGQPARSRPERATRASRPMTRTRTHQGQGKNKSKENDADDWYDPYDDKYQGSKSDANHGQRVSECNHRATASR